MYNKCPQCGHERKPDDTASKDVCPACGLIFSKWMKRRFHSEETRSSNTPRTSAKDYRPRIVALLFSVPENTSSAAVWGRAVLYIGLVVWGMMFIWMEIESNEIGNSFMHRVNLVFHEAGHVIFALFGRFISILGGTLGQLLMPLIVLFYFLLKNRDSFAASIGLWWFAQSLMDCAPYINDARSGVLMLLGGVTGADAPGYHDWENILGELGLLRYDYLIARRVDTAGEIFMLLAFLWGAYALYLQTRRFR